MPRGLSFFNKSCPQAILQLANATAFGIATYNMVMDPKTRAHSGLDMFVCGVTAMALSGENFDVRLGVGVFNIFALGAIYTRFAGGINSIEMNSAAFLLQAVNIMTGLFGAERESTEVNQNSL